VRDLACIVLDDLSAAGETRRQTEHHAHAIGLGDTDAGRAAIVANELATNAVKHGGGGLFLVRALHCGESVGVELLALDRGPGMRDVAGSLRDGHSTAGTMGNGLGAAQRLSSLFEIYAPPGHGTAVLSRVWAVHPGPPPPSRPLTVGAVCVALQGEREGGDAWAVDQTPGRAALLISDGLGHGEGAAEASAAAVETFAADPSRTPEQQVAALNTALRPTRGAAVAVAVVLPAQGTVSYAGLGNTAARVHSGESMRNLLSREGTAGISARPARQSAYPWQGDAMLLLHTDGLTTRWSLNDHPGLHHRHPSLIAGVLFRDHRRRHDDVTVVVAVPTRDGP